MTDTAISNKALNIDSRLVYMFADQPDALVLYLVLKERYEGSEEKFPLYLNWITKHLHWDYGKASHAKWVLLARGFLYCVHIGGSGPGDANLYQLNA